MGRRGKAARVPDRVWLHIASGVRRVVDPSEVYFLEAEGEHTWVRMRSRKRIKDVRRLGEVARLLSGHGFIRVHKRYSVNGRLVVEVRLRDNGRDWEVVMERPVGVVLEVGRTFLGALRRAYRDG